MHTATFPQLEEAAARNTLARALADPDASYVTLSARVGGTEDQVGRYALSGVVLGPEADDEENLDDDLESAQGTGLSRVGLAGDVLQWAKDTAANNLDGRSEQVFRIKVYSSKAGRTLMNLSLKAVSTQGDDSSGASLVVAPTLPAMPTFGDLLRNAESRNPDDPVLARFSSLVDLMGHGMGSFLGHMQSLLNMSHQMHSQQSTLLLRLCAQSEGQLGDARQMNGLLVDSMLNTRLNELERSGTGAPREPDEDTASKALSTLKDLGEAYINRAVDPDMVALYGKLQGSPDALAALKDPKVQDYIAANASIFGPMLRNMAGAAAPSSPPSPAPQNDDLEDNVE